MNAGPGTLADRTRAPSHPATESQRPVHRLIITIDGPAGTGKSTVARRLARRLGL